MNVAEKDEILSLLCRLLFQGEIFSQNRRKVTVSGNQVEIESEGFNRLKYGLSAVPVQVDWIVVAHYFPSTLRFRQLVHPPEIGSH